MGKRLLKTFVVIAAIISMLSTTMMAFAAEDDYTVESGDYLVKISKKVYGDDAYWKEIYEANKDTIKDPNLIYTGQVLVIPDLANNENITTPTETPAAETPTAETPTTETPATEVTTPTPATEVTTPTPTTEATNPNNGSSPFDGMTEEEFNALIAQWEATGVVPEQFRSPSVPEPTCPYIGLSLSEIVATGFHIYGYGSTSTSGSTSVGSTYTLYLLMQNNSDVLQLSLDVDKATYDACDALNGTEREEFITSRFADVKATASNCVLLDY